MTDKLRDAAQQALDVLEQLQGGCTDSDDGTVEVITVWCPEVVEALLAALVQQDAQEVPVINYALLHEFSNANGISYNALCKIVRDALNAAPTPPAQRVMLTDDEIDVLWAKQQTKPFKTHSEDRMAFARAVIEAYERKNGIK